MNNTTEKVTANFNAKVSGNSCDMGGADKGELVISVCESSTIGRSSLKVLLVEPESTNTFGELVNRYNVALSRQCDGFDSRTFRKKHNSIIMQLAR